MTYKITNSLSQVWSKNGKLHRDNDLPAVIRKDGTREWWVNGERHRENDLPAYIDFIGNKSWYKNGLLHRDGDFPAVEFNWIVTP